jgi:formylglycine-generating enzyme
VSTRLPNLGSRMLAPAVGAALAMLAPVCFSGCLVSFDGYELADAGGANGAASGGVPGSDLVTGGTSEAGSGGTSPIAGTSSGGVVGRAGADNGGAANGGGSAANGGGSAANGGGGAAAGSGGSAGNPAMCPLLLHGAILVEIPKPGGGIFCIDRSEVTNSDYAAFLATKPSTLVQSSECSANVDFAPASDATSCTQYDPLNKPKVPVACVNWCDAKAYCAWAGKRLCGKIGGGANAPADFANASKSEWFTACSHAGALKFPYGASGDIYDGSACVGADHGSLRPSAVPTASCQGGYDGVFDMSGNVSEWENSCAASTGLSDQCSYRGGSYLDLDTGTTPSLLCNSGTSTTPKAVTKARSTRDKEIGFRCCADP